MSMRLFFVLLTLGGSVYLLFREQGDRRLAIGALAASSVGFLLQLNVITLRLQYARPGLGRHRRLRRPHLDP